MLKACEDITQNGSVYNARIFTSRQAYKALPNPPVLYRADSGAQALLCDGVLTLDGVGFDIDELRQFVEWCGCKSVICTGAVAGRLALSGEYNRYTVMRYNGGVPAVGEGVCTQPKLDDVYTLLKATFENMAGLSFDSWYSDISLKMRRGLAMVYAVYEGTELCATAGVNYQNDITSVIGSVATAKQWRGRGFAARLINSLLRAVPQGKTVQIICQNEGAMLLYTRLGFEAVEEYVEIGR